MILLTPAIPLGEERYFAFSMAIDSNGSVSFDCVACSSPDVAAKSSELILVPSGKSRLCRGAGIVIGARGTSLALPIGEMLAAPLALIVAASYSPDSIANSIVNAVCVSPKINGRAVIN